MVIDWLKSETGQMALRKIVTLTAGYLVGKGFLDSTDVTAATIEALAGGLLVLVSWGLSSLNKRKHVETVKALDAAKVEVIAAKTEAAIAKEETQILVNQISPVKIIPLDKQ